MTGAVPSIQPGRTYPRRILAADDDPVVREFLNLYLTCDGVTVETAVDGEDALTRLEAGFDLLVLDLEMPNKSGFDVLRALGSNPSVPVVVLTSRTDAGAIAEAFELGASAYVLKPINKDSLIAKISAVYMAAGL